MNFIDVHCETDGGKNVLTSSFLRTPVKVDSNRLNKGATIGIRPEHIRIYGSATGNVVEARVKRKYITVGGQYLYVIEIDGVEVKVKIGNPSNDLINAESVWIELPIDRMVIFDGNRQRVHAPLPKVD